MAELVATGDAICRHLNAELVAPKPKGSGLGLDEIVRLTPHRAALELAAAVELGELKPPTAVAREWRRMVLYRHTLADELAQLGKDARKVDVAGIEALTTSKKHVHRQLRETTSRYGLKDCARVG